MKAVASRAVFNCVILVILSITYYICKQGREEVSYINPVKHYLKFYYEY